MDDIEEIMDFNPELLIIGKGNPGLMQVPLHLQKSIRKRGLELFIGPTPQAVKEYNRKHREKRTVAALHLTC